MKLLPILLILISFKLAGQNTLEAAIHALKDNKLDLALTYLNRAKKENLSSEVTLYYTGTVYKEIYKQREKNDLQSPARLESVKAYSNLLKLEEPSVSYVDGSKNGLKYLAATFYGDVVKSLGVEQKSSVVLLFELYVKTLMAADPTYDFSQKQVQFEEALKQKYVD